MSSCKPLRIVELWRWLLSAAALALSLCPALAADPPTTPILRLETGMHTALINRIATDAQRPLAGHRLGRQDRPGVGDRIGAARERAAPAAGGGQRGQALSRWHSRPTGRQSPWRGGAAKWDETVSIYLFDRASGRLLRRIAGLPNVISHLAYSPDGRWLAASLGENGVRLFEAASGRETGRDADYGGSSYSVDFSRDGRRLVTTSDDGQVRLYAVEEGRLSKLTQAAAPGGKQPFFARFSPDGRHIAVGFDDTTAVNVLDATTLALAYAPDTRGVDNGNLSKVAWSADGQFLYAAGRWQVKGDLPVRRWSAGGRGAFTDIPVARNTVMDLAALPDGRLVFGAGDPDLGRHLGAGRGAAPPGPRHRGFPGVT